MSTVGQKERKTQQRVVKLFRDTLGYVHLGDWGERVDFTADFAGEHGYSILGGQPRSSNNAGQGRKKR